jgi:hypothetical protein
LNSGATAPLVNEVDLIDLPVAGAIPQDLNGVLVRNGPNPLTGRFKGNDVPPDPAFLGNALEMAVALGWPLAAVALGSAVARGGTMTAASGWWSATAR